MGSVELKNMKPMCCGKLMQHEQCVQSLIHPNGNVQGWTCLECGYYITIIEDQLDEEELFDLNEQEEC